MPQVFNVDLELWIAMMLGSFILLLILVLIQWVQLRKMKRKYKQMLGEGRELNLEEAIISVQQRQSVLNEKADHNAKQIEAILQTMKTMKSKVGILRYNAFGDRGNDLSFSAAIIDSECNGLVLSGIHSRDDSYIYAKPVEKGTSRYALSPEEKEAISQASQQA